MPANDNQSRVADPYGGSAGRGSEMDDVSDTSSEGGDRKLLLAQVRDAFGRAAYTHKTHESKPICAAASTIASSGCWSV